VITAHFHRECGLPDNCSDEVKAAVALVQRHLGRLLSACNGCSLTTQSNTCVVQACTTLRLFIPGGIPLIRGCGEPGCIRLHWNSKQSLSSKQSHSSARAQGLMDEQGAMQTLLGHLHANHHALQATYAITLLLRLQSRHSSCISVQSCKQAPPPS